MRVLTWQAGRWRVEEHPTGWRLFEGPQPWVWRLDAVSLVEVGDFLISQGVHPVDDLDRDGR